MRIGHLDGKGSIYDDLGNPVLHPGELVLCHVPSDNIEISEGSSIWNMRILFAATPEKGDLYVTDRRILFTRKPDAALAWRAYGYYPAGLPDSVAAAFKASALKRRDALEYCEIELSEVVGFWVDRKTAGFLFLRGPPSVTRKVRLHLRGPSDQKFSTLREVLSEMLPYTKLEDKRGSYGIGAEYPFLGRKRKQN